MALGACSTPMQRELTPVERRQLDNVLGLDLAQQFEAQITLRNDEVVAAYLEQLGRSLMQLPELKNSPLQVKLIREKQDPWRNYALPGTRVYVSIPYLKDVRFENEVAAILALELGHIARRTAVSRLGEPSAEGARRLPGPLKAPAFFGSNGIFAFTEEQHAAALEPALEMLYSAGFDPRGLTSLMARYQQNPDRSPYSAPTVAKMLENTRRIIALHAPLRNPIVRSDRFVALQRRIKAL